MGMNDGNKERRRRSTNYSPAISKYSIASGLLINEQELPENPWEKQEYFIRAFDYIQGKWRVVNVMELSDGDFRKWLCYRLKIAGTKEDFEESL